MTKHLILEYRVPIYVTIEVEGDSVKSVDKVRVNDEADLGAPLSIWDAATLNQIHLGTAAAANIDAELRLVDWPAWEFG